MDFLVPHNLPPKEHTLATITGTFSIKNSIIIGASDDNLLDNSLDKTHIKNSAGIPLLTSKSIRGPIRHRALKILKTIGQESKAKEIVENLFGMVYEDDRKNKKGRIVTKDIPINGAESKQIQPRIKIDRFTGGTMNTALLNAQPLWHDKEEFELTFEIEDYEPREIAIMLLVMKDLMNEDLPIGGEKAIGRGVLTGTNLKVEKDENNFFELTVLKDGKIKIDEKGEFTYENNIKQWITDLPKN